MNHTVYKSSTRQIIFKVFKEFVSEFQTGKLISDLGDVYGRTAKITGVSESTVRRIKDEGMKNGGEFVTPGKNTSRRQSSSGSEDAEMEQLPCAGSSGHISGFEYLDSDFDYD